jgi:hypothetical protein
MKPIYTHYNRTLVALLLLVNVALLGCAPEFDDPTKAVLKKPEVLSIVLDPPEAAPGETVRASFLLADDRGVLEANANMWLPIVGGLEMSDVQMDAVLEEMNLEFESLGSAEFEFTVPSASSFVFDDDGLSGHMISLFTAMGENPSPDVSVDAFFASLESLVDSGDVKASFRTLVVSKNTKRNLNPLVLSINAGDNEQQDTLITILTSDNLDKAAARQTAADNPLVVTQKEEVVFSVDVEDDSNGEDALTYQWISTAGDFRGLRKQVQEFDAPGFLELEEGEVDQTGLENADPRVDPNLRPVWLIVRDDGIPGSLGQSWAEFYIRVVSE